MNPVVHFEMPYEDRNRMAAFYTRVFGWKPRMLGPEMGDYVVVATAETDEAGHPRRAGAINGGFFRKPEDPSGHHPSVVIAVQNLGESLQKVRQEGGTVLGEPMEIPGVGLYAGFTDTEGNRVSMLQPAAEMA